MELLTAFRRHRDVTALHGLGRTTIALGLAVTCAGCTDSAKSSSPGPHAAPTRAADCNDLGTQRGDGFVLTGTDWSYDVHAYDEPAMVYACVQPGTGGRVSLQTSTSGRGITVTPRSRATSSSETGVLAFRVRVRHGATGTLTMRQESPGATSGGPGPTVVAEADRWHFTTAE